MTARSRAYLAGKFANGEKPTGADFADRADSFVHKTEDSIAISKVTGLQAALNTGSIKVWNDGYASDVGYGENEFVSYNEQFFRSKEADNHTEPNDLAKWEPQGSNIDEATIVNVDEPIYNGAIGVLDKLYIEKGGVAHRIVLDDLAELISSYGFTPAELDEFIFWGDVTDFSKIITGSGKISQITDKSGLGNHLVQATSGNQPAYYSSGGSNNKPYINLSAGKLIRKTGLDYDLPYTVYMLARINTYIDGGTILQFGDDFTNGIVQKTKGGINSLTAVAQVNWNPASRNYNRLARWQLLSFQVTAEGNVYPSINNEPILDAEDKGVGLVGFNRISIGGDNNPNFDLSELLIVNNNPSVELDAKIRNYFLAKYQPPLNEFLYAYGDSITAGYNSDVTYEGRLTKGYVGKVAAALGVNVYNYGISGTGVLPSTGNNFIDIYNTKNLSRKGYILFAYGTNDTIDATWKSTYKSLIQYFIDRGFDKSKMCIVSPPYQSARLDKLPQCRTYCEEIATELNIRFADWYSWSEDNGGDTLLADGTHPTDPGHTGGANVVIDALD